MPNWCMNTIAVSHEDPEMIQRFVTSLTEGKLFEEFIPIPQELRETVSPNKSSEQNIAALMDKYGYADWYGYCVGEWGTKWDVQGEGIVSPDGKDIDGFFDSAWSPPIGAYEKLAELGFEIEAYYYEPGMSFCGKWTNELGDECYEYDFSDPDWADGIPKDIIDVAGLDSEYNYFLDCEREQSEGD